MPLVYRDRALILIPTCDTSLLQKRARGLILSFSFSLFLLLSWCCEHCIFLCQKNENWVVIVTRKYCFWNVLCGYVYTSELNRTGAQGWAMLHSCPHWLIPDTPSQHIFNSCSVGPTLTLTVHSCARAQPQLFPIGRWRNYHLVLRGV